MLYNGQTHSKNIAAFMPQDFQSMFGHFTTLCLKGLSLSNLGESFLPTTWKIFSGSKNLNATNTKLCNSYIFI